MKVKIIPDSVRCFLFAFLLHIIYIAPLGDMLNGSGDATSIWATITSYYSEYVVSSYVMYKGVYSIYPYVWLYQLSTIFGVGGFFFIKIFFALLFACAAGLCMPYIMSVLLKREINVILRAVWIVIAFWIWEQYRVFITLSVDLPNFAYLTMAVAAALKLTQTNSFSKKILLYCFLSGLLFGFASGGSGQYSLTVYLLTLYVAIILIKNSSSFRTSFKSKIVAPLICVAVIISGAATVKFIDTYYEKTIIQPFRDRGDWLPTGDSWLRFALSRDLTMMSYGTGTPTLPDNRGVAIIMEYEGENAESKIERIKAGSDPYSYQEYIKLILRNPQDFLSRWCNRFFWAVNMDNGRSSAVRMITGFSLLYLSLFYVYKNNKLIKSFFSPGILVVMAFIIPTLVPCLMHIEKRYSLTVQALIICTGLFGGVLQDAFASVVNLVKECYSQKSIKPAWNSGISYPALIYVLFVGICFLHHAVIMETFGPTVGILFTR